MSTTRLKILLFAIWGGFFLLLGVVLALLWMQNQAIQQPHALPPPGTAAGGNKIFIPGNTPEATASATPKIVNSPTPLPSNTPPAVTFAPSLPEKLPERYDPYTGLIPADHSRLERRPMAVKITNFPRRVRAYQYGLTRADVAYEYYIEDGLTRFIAVFYGQDAEKAGPVRSGRYFDEHIARMYQAYLVFANADERVEEYLLNSDLLKRLVVPTGLNCPPFCRDKKINDYNNFFIDTAGLTEYTRKIGHTNERLNLRSTLFDLMPPTWPLEVNEITIRYSIYSYHSWRYNPASQRYERFADAADAESVSAEVYGPHLDILTGEQISAANVVVLVVPHNFKTEFDREDQVFDIQLVNEGRAYVFRQGRAAAAIWQRDAIDQPIRLFDMSRSPIGLTPGNTFYIVIKPESSLEQGEKSVRFTFSIPARRATPTPTPPGFIASPTPRGKP
jgi:hypothetical protein